MLGDIVIDMSIRIACNNMPDHIDEGRKMLIDNFSVDFVSWNRSQIIEHIAPYDAFITSISLFDKEIFDVARQLKVVATPSTGTDHIDLVAAEKRQVAVLSIKNETEYLAKITSTAEQAFALLLSVMRKLPFAFEAVRTHNRWVSADFRGHSLSGKTLGIIGYGRLGKMMARYGEAFGMNIVAYDPYVDSFAPYVMSLTFDELLRCSDVISLHVHLNDTTRNMLNKQAFQLMKKNVVIINTSRGALIDESELLLALKEHRILGAGLDVLASELYGDISDDPLVQYAKDHDNVVISPHIGGVTFESQELAYTKIVSMIIEWFDKHNKRE